MSTIPTIRKVPQLNIEHEAGTSNGNVLQSCSSGNIGGTTQWSICFPVKKGATWSVTGTIGSITVWTTPLN